MKNATRLGFLVLATTLAACDANFLTRINASNLGTPSGPTATPTAQSPTEGLFIRNKQSSNLSADLATITLSVDAVDPEGKPLSILWEDSSKLGVLNSNKGNSVQWKVTSPVTGTGVIKVTVTNGVLTETAEIRIPVAEGKIQPAELTPEVMLSPQSNILFRPLPLSLGLSDDVLISLGVKTKVTLSATTYKYDPVSNEKIKTPFDVNEMRWQTADPELITVSENGTVRPADGSKVGDASVTAISKTDAAQRASANVKVRYLTTKIDLSFEKSSLAAGTSMKLGATVTYSNPEDRGRVIYTDSSGRELSWESSDKTRVQVDTLGNLRALADASAGEVTITVRSNYDPTVSEAVVLKVSGDQ